MFPKRECKAIRGGSGVCGWRLCTRPGLRSYCLRYALTPGSLVGRYEPQVVSGSPCVAVVRLRARTRAEAWTLW